MELKSNRKFGTNRTLGSSLEGEKSGVVFFLFCLWTIVNLCRPQDIFPALAPLRPALTFGALTILFTFLSIEKKSLVALKEKQVRYFLYLVLVMIIGIPTSLHRWFSFQFIFFDYMLIVAYLIVFIVIVDSLDRLYRVIFLSCLGSAIYTAFSILNGNVWGGRLNFGSMFDPNDLSFFALCFIPLSLIFVSKDNRFIIRVLCLIGFFLGIALVLLSGSRGGALGLAIGASVVFFRETVSVRRPFKIFAVIAGVLLLSLSSINTDRLFTLFDLEQDYNVTGDEGRLSLWRFGIIEMLRNPLTGVGVGRFQDAIGDHRQRLGSGSQKWQVAHNSVIQIGTETGVFGLVLFLMMSWNAVKIFARTGREATSTRLKKIGEMGLAGFLGMFTAAFFISQAYSIYWAFYIVFSAVVLRLLMSEQAVEDKGVGR